MAQHAVLFVCHANICRSPLAQALFKSVELDQEVPTEHYKAVAEVISYVWRMQGRLRPDRPAA